MVSLAPMRYSFIIPVYNRPDELRELLESIALQQLNDYEVIVIEDGSSLTSEAVIHDPDYPFSTLLSST